MKKVFKIFYIIGLMLFVFNIAACNDEDDKKTELTSLKVIAVNDLHGAIEVSDDNYGMAGISWYVNKERENKEQAVLVLAAGDMFQGSAISNVSYGKNVVDLMNVIGFDAMTLGNHEFDWGLDTILNYVDENQENGEANFPFLACNLIQKDINAVPENVDSYQIVDFEQFQVGIIGYIGPGIEEDISASKVNNYYFDNPVNYIKDLTQYLRNDKGCELVIVMGHDDNSSIQTQIASLSGSSAVDMIIAGHTHTTYTRYLTNGNKVSIPVVQSGTAAEALTDTVFLYNKEDNSFLDGYADTVDLEAFDVEFDQNIIDMVNQMNVAISPVMDEVLGLASRNVNKTSVLKWTADSIKTHIDCDIAFLNSGGIRQSAFPINEGNSITVRKMYEILPFDNIIKKCTLTGAQLKEVLNISDLVFSSNLEQRNNTFYLNGEEVLNDKNYVIACPDYVFDRDEQIYDNGLNIVFDGNLVRDIMILQLKVETANGKKWLE